MHIYLVDLSLTFGTMQNHLLHTADLLNKEQLIPVTVCCPANSQLAQKIKNLEIPLLEFTSQNPKSFTNIFKLWFASLKKHNCLIHTFSNTSSLLGWIIFKLRKKKSTILIHTHKNAQAISVDKNNLMPLHWRDADKIICDSTHMVQLLANASINPARIEKISAGVDPVLLVTHIPSTKKRFIFASLSPKEGASSNEIIIKAMPFLWQNKELPEWEIRIFGRGLDVTALLGMALSVGVESHLSILGNQNLAEVLPPCDALIVPSCLLTGAQRYLGIAWYNELALICARNSPNLELVKSDDNALIYNCDEPQHLAYIMEKAMLNPELIATIIQNGKKMQPLVCIDNSVKQCYKLYIECISKHGWVISQPKIQGNKQVDEQPIN